MAYASSNPPVQWTQSFGGQVCKEWSYKSSDALATVAGSSYFSNGHSLGMRITDSIYVVQVSTLTPSSFVAQARGTVIAVTTGAGASITFITTSS